MKKILIVVIVITLGQFKYPLYSQTQQEIQEIYSLLSHQQYISLINKICELRENAYYKNAFMDYCLAFSYCRLGQNAISTKWFDHLIKNYNSLTPDKIQELVQLKSECQNPTVPEHSATGQAKSMETFLNAMNPDGFENQLVGFEGKMGYPGQNERVTKFDFEHATFSTSNRQFTQYEKKEAADYYNNLIQDKAYQNDSSQHLLVFHTKNATSIKSHMLELEEYYNYYQDFFNLGESGRLITVFYCLDRFNFDNIAKDIHNMTIPKSTFGYASSSDLILAGIASSTWLGAMKHELFHIMIRSYVGDIPAWLDEGIACCYESSSLHNNKLLVNMQNYRTDLLKNVPELKYTMSSKDFKPLPTVTQFTNFSWPQFSGNPGDLKVWTGVNYSLSYVFVKYLMDNNKLSKVVDAFRNRSIRKIQKSGEESYIVLNPRTSNEILTEILQMDMNQIQSSFESYCKNLLGFNLYTD
jgi:hypothetical protein